MKRYGRHSNQRHERLIARSSAIGLSLTSAVLLASPAMHAATLCVDQHRMGCAKTISAAVASASAGDTIKVSAGTYHEDVVIGVPLSLIGAGARETTIDASGVANGIYVDGADSGGQISGVLISGFLVKNANFEGILVTQGTSVTITGNVVAGNDKQAQGNACNGLPMFEADETTDCGGGIHVISSQRATIADNLVTGNASGILMSDELATNHDNIISRNLVTYNKTSGIMLTSKSATYGTYNNIVSENDANHNGGTGIVISSLVPGSRSYASTVVNNHLTGNSGPGVLIVSGANLSTGASRNPNNPDADRNTILSNFIAQNGCDADHGDKKTTGILIYGPAPITSIALISNVITGQEIGVAFNSGSTLDAHLNDFLGRQVGVDSMASGGVVDATANWWGNGGAGAFGTATTEGVVIATPQLTRPEDGRLGHGLDLWFDYFHNYEFGPFFEPGFGFGFPELRFGGRF